MKLTVAQVEALARLRAVGDFKVFEGVVREYERELTERCLASHDVVVIHQSQGAVDTARALLRFIDEAPATLRKLADQTKEHA